MSETWQLRTVGESVSITKGITYASSDYAPENEGHVFLTIKCFAKGGGFNAEGIKYFRGIYSPEQEIQPGELLVAKTDLTRDGDIIGSPMIVPDFGEGRKMLPSMDLSVMRSLNEDTEILFLFYRLMLGDARRFMWAHSAGSTVLHLESKALPKFSFRAPRRDEQRRIAEILSTVDEAIEQTESLIAKYQQIKAGLMHDLFTRGVTPDGHLRPTHAQAPHLYKESPLGWIPEEWEVVPVQDLCGDIVDCPHSTPTYVQSGIPCIRTADMQPGQLLLDQAYKVAEEEYWERVARLVPQRGDVIYSREGERLGIASSVGNERVCLGQRVMLLRPGSNTDPDFLVWAMNTPAFYRRIVAGLGATTSPHVNVRDIRKTMLNRPSSAEQKIIGRLLARQTILLNAEEFQLFKLKQIKQGFMHDLLTGRVRVKVAETASI
jgi:type I restriction enzyme, S subunit